MRRIVTAIFILTIFCANVSANQTSSDEALTERIRGYQYQRQEDLLLAKEHYMLAIKLDPFYACPHNDLGTIYESFNNYERAETEYLKAIELDAKYLAAYTNLALLYEKQLKYSKAIECWNMRATYGELNDIWTKRAKERSAYLLNKHGSIENMRAQEEARTPHKYNFGPRTPEKKPQTQQNFAREAKKIDAPQIKSQPSAIMPISAPNADIANAQEIARSIAGEKELQIATNKSNASLAYKDAQRDYNARNYEEAIEHLNDALLSDPASEKINSLLQKAQLKLEKRRQISAEAESKSFNTAKRLYKDGKIKEATGQFNKVLAINPGNREAAMYLGLINASSKTAH